MKTLTKKYRLLWDVKTKEIVGDPYEENNIGSQTYVPDTLGCYEAQLLSSIESKIKLLGLKKTDL